jgi:hypothetical protein
LGTSSKLTDPGSRSGLPERLNMPKRRKPRTTGSDLDFDGSHIFGWPAKEFTIAWHKLYTRLRNGLCLGCGMKICKCKSKSPNTKFGGV